MRKTETITDTGKSYQCSESKQHDIAQTMNTTVKGHENPVIKCPL